MFQVEYLVSRGDVTPIAGQVRTDSDDPQVVARRVSDHFLASAGGPRELAKIYPHGLRWLSEMVRSTAGTALEHRGKRVCASAPPDSWVSTLWSVRGDE